MVNSAAYFVVRYYDDFQSTINYVSLKDAQKALEEHIDAMGKVGGFEFIRGEEARKSEMRYGDMSITAYERADADGKEDKEVDCVIIRPIKA